MIECNKITSEIEIKDIVLKISEKWTNIKIKQPTPYCPYIFLYGLSDNKILNIKKMLQNEDFIFIDGYDFKNATFNVRSIIRKANYYKSYKNFYSYKSNSSVDDGLANEKLVNVFVEMYRDLEIEENVDETDLEKIFDTH